MARCWLPAAPECHASWAVLLEVVVPIEGNGLHPKSAPVCGVPKLIQRRSPDIAHVLSLTHLSNVVAYGCLKTSTGSAPCSARLGNLPQRHGAADFARGAPDADFRTYGRCKEFVRLDPCLRNFLFRNCGHANPPGIRISLAQIAGITKSRQRAADAPLAIGISLAEKQQPPFGLPAWIPRDGGRVVRETAETHFFPYDRYERYSWARTFMTVMLASPTTIQAIVFFPPWPPLLPRSTEQKVPLSTCARGRPARQLVGVSVDWNMWVLWCPLIRRVRGRSPASHLCTPPFSMLESRKPPSLGGHLFRPSVFPNPHRDASQPMFGTDAALATTPDPRPELECLRPSAARAFLIDPVGVGDPVADPPAGVARVDSSPRSRSGERADRALQRARCGR